MTSPFTLDWPGFKAESKKFIDRMRDPSLTIAQVEGAKKAYAVEYLNLDCNETDRYQASIAFQMAIGLYLRRTTP